MSKFLDLNGLSYFWGKITSRLGLKADIVHTMLGQHNVADPNDDYLLMVGNGTDENNPLTVFSIDKNGNVLVDPGTLSAENILSTLLSMMSSTIDRGNPGSSDIYGGSGTLKLVDVNGTQIGYMQPIQLSNGKEGIQIGVGNSDNSDFNTIEIGYDANDEAYITLADPAAWRNAINTISKNGDTISGTLTANGTYFCAKNTNIDRDGADPSGAVTGNARFYMRDKDGEFIGQMRMAEETNGRMSLQLMVGRENESNSEVTNSLSIRVDKTGNAEYGVSSPVNFRSAISAQVKPSVLYNSSTGTTGTVSLSDSAANYNHMRIYFKGTRTNGSVTATNWGSVTIPSPNGKQANLILHFVETASSKTYGYTYFKSASISGTSITNQRSGYSWEGEGNSSASTASSYNFIHIMRVEAWNE